MLAVIFIILMVINLYLYHKIFNVVYFDVKQGLLKEIAWSFFVAAIELTILKTVGIKVLDWGFGAIGWLLRALVGLIKIAVILIGIIIVIGIIYGIYVKIKGNLDKNMNEEKENDFVHTNEFAENETAENQEILKNNEGEKVEEGKNIISSDGKQDGIKITVFCTNCGKKILRNAKFCNFCGKENNKG